jgi:hypothetical protein
MKPAIETILSALRSQVHDLFSRSETQVTLFVDTSVGLKPAITICPFVEMIGYLPRPSKAAYPLWTFTTLLPLIQSPSNAVETNSEKFDTGGGGRMCTVTATPLVVMFPDETLSMPGTAATY